MITIRPYTIKSIQFLPYDASINTIVEDVIDLIASKITDAQFEHIGSTAILDMPGKNVINIQLLTERNHYEKNIENLHQLGFIKNPTPLKGSLEPLCVATVVYKTIEYNVHILLTPKNSEYHHNAVFFRDYLTSHPLEAERYAAIKKHAVDNGKTDPLSYNKAKEPFIWSILAKMKAD